VNDEQQSLTREVPIQMKLDEALTFVDGFVDIQKEAVFIFVQGEFEVPWLFQKAIGVL